MNRASLGLFSLLLVACTATPPANWARGGAALDLPRARWVRGDLLVDLMPDGRIFVNGSPEATLDRAGRLYDEDAQPIALLEPDGRVVGPDDEPLGQVGVMHAARADEAQAWLTVTESGEVIRYDDEGERATYGVWMGCNGSARAHQACVLVTHVLATRLRSPERQGGAGVSLGIGIGVGIPIR